MKNNTDDKLYGRNPVIEALENGRAVDKIYLQERLNHPAIGRIRNLAKERGIHYQFV